MNDTLQQTSKKLKELLSGIYPERETEQMLFLLYEKIIGLSRLQIITNPNTKISNSHYNQIITIAKRLQNHEPIQYILGETEFYGLPFQVNQSVLIPRPETEELVDWVLKDNSTFSANILDIGTGSGCIAVALSKNLPSAKVFALDISDAALKTASANAKKNNAAVTFLKMDILHDSLSILQQKIDLIVSNPPYVTQLDKQLMHANVLDFEPHLALFVEDTDPLLFYRVIAQKAKSILNNNAIIYFELNESLGLQVKKLLNEEGYINTILRADINGKTRMIKAQYHSKKRTE